MTPLTPRVASQLDLPPSATELVVMEVDPSGVAADAGLQPGDVVKRVNGREVKSVPDLRAALESRRDTPALFLVTRNGASLFLDCQRRGRDRRWRARGRRACHAPGPGRLSFMLPTRERLVAALPVVVSLGVFLAALEVLRLELRTVTWPELTGAMASMPPERLALALLLTALNYLALTGYDVLAFESIGRRVAAWRIMGAALASPPRRG